MRDVLRAGADKVAVNSAAVRDPDLVNDLCRAASAASAWSSASTLAPWPAQPGRWEVVVQGGREATGLDAVEWIERCVANGAGEVLLTSIDRDGTQDGFDIELLRTVTDRVHVPVIASGGAGTPARHGRGRDRRPRRRRAGSFDLPSRHPLHRGGQGGHGGSRCAGAARPRSAA